MVSPPTPVDLDLPALAATGRQTELIEWLSSPDPSAPLGEGQGSGAILRHQRKVIDHHYSFQETSDGDYLFPRIHSFHFEYVS